MLAWKHVVARSPKIQGFRLSPWQTLAVFWCGRHITLWKWARDFLQFAEKAGLGVSLVQPGFHEPESHNRCIVAFPHLEHSV